MIAMLSTSQPFEKLNTINTSPNSAPSIKGLFKLNIGLKNNPLNHPENSLILQFKNTQFPDFKMMLGDTAHSSLSSPELIINSHLLDNGNVDIKVTIKNKENKELHVSEHKYCIANEGTLAEKIKRSLLKNKCPLVINGLCDSSHLTYNDDSLIPWFDRPDADNYINNLFNTGKITLEEKSSLKEFVTNGFVILPESLEPSLIEAVNTELDEVIAKKYQNYEYGTSQRLELLHLHYPAIRKVLTYPRVLTFLELIFGVKPRPCQTLTYIFGSQQDFHQDTIHLTPFPAGYMCGVWVAFEDVQPFSGELEVLPGSHRFPRIYTNSVNCSKVTNGDWGQFANTVVKEWEKYINESKIEPFSYRPKAGSILIWHENLMHRGSIRIDKSLSRRSIVSHYFGEGAISYYDSSGLIAGFLPGY
jgi:hypothetical protein